MNNFLIYSFIGPGGPEFILILFILLILFGVKDTPKIMRNISDILIKLKHSSNEFKHDLMYSDMRSEADEREKIENGSYTIDDNNNANELNNKTEDKKNLDVEKN